MTLVVLVFISPPSPDSAQCSEGGYRDQTPGSGSPGHRSPREGTLPVGLSTRRRCGDAPWRQLREYEAPAHADPQAHHRRHDGPSIRARVV